MNRQTVSLLVIVSAVAVLIGVLVGYALKSRPVIIHEVYSLDTASSHFPVILPFSQMSISLLSRLGRLVGDTSAVVSVGYCNQDRPSLSVVGHTFGGPRMTVPISESDTSLVSGNDYVWFIFNQGTDSLEVWLWDDTNHWYGASWMRVIHTDAFKYSCEVLDVVDWQTELSRTRPPRVKHRK